MTPLRQKMINDMKLRRFAIGIQKLYVYAVEDLAKYYNRSPDLISEEEAHGYLLYLQEERKHTRKLPTIFSRSELIKLFDATDSLRNLMILTSAYSAGLRVSEVVSLKLDHIESSRKLIRVEQGKGNQH